MKRNDFFLGAAVIAVALAVMLVAAGSSDTAAAWAQAAGTVGAIGAAVWVSNWQQRAAADAEAKDRFSRMQTLTFRLLPLVQDIAVNLDRVKGAAHVHDYGRALLPVAKCDPSEAIKQMTFGIAWRDNIYDHFNALPPAWAQTLAQLLYEVATYDRVITALLKHAAQHGVVVIDDIHSEQIDPTLEYIGQLVKKIEPELQLMRVA